MIKTLALIVLTLSFTGCEFLGWDSAGGNNGDNHMDTEGALLGKSFYLEVPMAYPLMGSAEVTTESDDNYLSVADISFLSDTPITELTDADALKIVQAACDETATSILNIDFGASEATVSWENSNSDMPDLTISNETSNDLELRTVSCIAF